MSLKKSGRFVSWILKLVKSPLLKFAKAELIPMLQEKVNAGAIDEQVDGIIETVIIESINKI